MIPYNPLLKLSTSYIFKVKKQAYTFYLTTKTVSSYLFLIQSANGNIHV